MASTFVNLHMHTETGSPLDGFARTDEIIERALELEYDTIAVTDHGSMSGILDLYTEGKNKEKKYKGTLNVIPGMEVYCVNDRTVRIKGETNAHLVLLAKNKEGYQNLLKLNFEGYKTGAVKVYDRVIPRVDLSLLEQHGKGVIATSACLVGTIPLLLKQGKEHEAVELVSRYKEIFDAFYLEVQPTHLIGIDQKEMNRSILELHKKTKVPIVVTLDSHYVKPEDRIFHHILLAIQSKKDIYDKTRLFFESNPLMSEEEILREFPKEFVDTTREVAKQCEKATYLDSTSGYKIPHFPIPNDPEFEAWKQKRGQKEEKISETNLYFRYKITKGWNKKIKPILDKELDENKKESIRRQYYERLESEKKVIEDMKFSDYFLIVADMLEECDRRKISRGTGRGSAGGCLISFLLDITKLNPIQYDLLFSRFLNADRISMPDIDSDISQSRRDEIKQYLVEKYGQDKVASIATFGTMKVKAAVKDVVRSLALGDTKSETFRLADRISKSVPDGDNPEVTFEEAYNYKDLNGKNEFKEYCDTLSVNIDGREVTLGQCLKRFEGITRQMGIHAAGVIISTEPLAETLPMIIQNDVVATAYDGPTLEKAGYLKLDVLGLKTLDVIDETVRYVKEVYGEEVKNYPLVGIDYDAKLPNAEQLFLDAFKKETNENKKKAARAYHLYRRGKTAACFQVSGSGMQALLKGVKPNNIEDIAAVLALFRPGPLGSGMTQEYAERKNGKKPIEYKHPALEPILRNTYGVITYQEQVMRLAMDIAGFTQAEADTLRKAVGKKIKSLMDQQETKFKEGALKKGFTDVIKINGQDVRLVDYLWGQIVEFAAYGFNKCLVGETKIATTQGIKTIKELRPGDKLYSLKEDGQFVVNELIEIIDTEQQEVFKVVLENGSEIECTLDHKFLCADQKFHTVREIFELGLTIEGEISTRIKALIPIGIRETFNLSMQEPFHNYKLGNGLVSANSHSVAYALTSYKQVFLKANYPAAFWAAVLSHESDEQKRNSYISEIRQTLKNKNPASQIKLTAVDINSSGLSYVCVSPNEIRRDLVSLKGVGEAAVEEIVAKRPFNDFLDFLDKVDSRKINTRVIRALIRAGAFDSLNKDGKFTRKFLEYTFERAKESLGKYKKKNKIETIAGTDFKIDWDALLLDEIAAIRAKENPQFEYGEPEWDTDRICEDEIEVYGMAVSSHPFDAFIKEETEFQKRFAGRYITLDQDFDLMDENMTVATMAIIKFKPREIACKNGTTLRNYTIEDRYGVAELTVFETEYKHNKDAFKVGNIIQFVGTITKKYKKITFLSVRRGEGMIAFFPSKKNVT